MAALYEGYLEIPVGAVYRRRGFSLDIGGSLIKLAYIPDKDDAVHDDKLRVHLAAFPRDQLDAALQHIADRCTLSDVNSDVTVCGVGCHQFAEKVNSRLKIKITTISEMTCFSEAFKFLTEHVPPDQLILPLPGHVTERTAKETKEFLDLKERAKREFDYEERQAAPPEDAEERTDDVLPCCLLMLGSGAGVMQIKGDGTMILGEGITRCGRMFLGLGKILTGATTFEELISLAEQGDSRAVDITGRDMKTGSTDDVYSCIPDDLMLYCFGKATDRSPDEFRKEDLARGLLSSIAQGIAQVVHLWCVLNKLPRCYVCGSFAGSSELVRTEVAKWFLPRSAMLQLDKVDLHFLKHGGYYGVVGALLVDLRKEI